ncbi:MAG: ATP-binding protein [Candidatus Zixiibacteriota bacterium]
MTYAGKIRSYLLIVAIFPPLLMMLVIFFSANRQADQTDKRNADAALNRFIRFDNAYKNNIALQLRALADSKEISDASMILKSGSPRKIEIKKELTGFGFIELIDRNMIVLASAHRPGLLRMKIQDKLNYEYSEKTGFYETVEYDIEGPHPSLAGIIPVDSNILLYAGIYIDHSYCDMVGAMLSAEINIYLENESAQFSFSLDRVNKSKLYMGGDKYYSLLMGGKEAGYYMTAIFIESTERPLFSNLLQITTVVALFSTAIALLLGIYISGRTRKEIDNLIKATARVAGGDYNTAVMAFDEGEFAQLAESFSKMVANLKKVRSELATTEKIAAWKVVGQKVAHEIKNPLTPITISIDDLQSSYHEKLPDFEKTMNETTSTIKTELARLTKLLDQFVSFARMEPPQIIITRLKPLIDELTQLYQKEIESGRITIKNKTNLGTVKLDPEKIKQVIINLIKNSLEANDRTKAILTFSDRDSNLIINIFDNGPGFPEKILEAQFTPYQTTKKDGSGLGLAICQRIVHDHRGTIEIFNNEKGGAGVKIAIPVGDD